MTTKDYVYLSIIALTAVVFYLNGFYSGIGRALDMVERAGKERDTEPESADLLPTPNRLASIVPPTPFSKNHRLSQSPPLSGDFGDN